MGGVTGEQAGFKGGEHRYVSCLHWTNIVFMRMLK